MLVRTVRALYYKTLVLVAGAGLLLLFYLFNPADAGFFPPCPFRLVTGLLCPGCGSQRAVHALLHGEVGAAFLLNPMMVVAIPYVVALLSSQSFMPNSMWAKRLSGRYAITLTGVSILLYWIGRNLVELV